MVAFYIGREGRATVIAVATVSVQLAVDERVCHKV